MDLEPDPIGRTIMGRLTAERLRRRIRQADVARAFGVTQPYVCNIEKGRRGVSLSRIVEYAEIVDIRPRALAAMIAGAIEERAVTRRHAAETSPRRARNRADVDR